MLWSEAIALIDQKALAVGLRDKEGQPLDASEAVAIMIPFSGWDDLEQELQQGTATPEAFVAWATAHVEKFRRERVRRRIEKLKKTVPHKIPHGVEVDV